MDFKKATERDSDAAKQIVHQTIEEIYPHYYPKGAVEFFLEYHNIEAINKDICDGNVYLVYMNGSPVATVTINADEINRLFVLPGHQRKGIGSYLLQQAEKIAFCKQSVITVYASLSGFPIYQKNGYHVTEYLIDDVKYGDKLCYYIMKKQGPLN